MRGASQGWKNREVWKHEEMFKTLPMVVTAQNTSVVLSRLCDSELWDVSLCFTIHIALCTACVCVTLAGVGSGRGAGAPALAQIHPSLASIGIPFADMVSLPIWYL